MTGESCETTREDGGRTMTDDLFAGEIVTLGTRHLRVSGMPDGTVCRDFRKRVAVRNVLTNRLSYVPEWRLLKGTREPISYDQKQLGAIDTICTVCKHMTHMTTPQPVCDACQRKERKS